MMKLNFRSREVAGGLSFVVVAILGLWISRDYPIGTATAMSTGYVPRLLCWILLVIGLLIAGKALLGEAAGIENIAWRPLIMVTVSILAFAFTVERFGMAIASVLVVVFGSFAGRDIRARSIIASAILLTAGCILVFVWALGQPIPILPGS
jgi:hypothetical protein